MKVYDISEFQPDDRVAELVEHGAEGIILKLGETINGEQELDPKLYYFYSECKKYNIPIGLYFVSHAHNADEFMQEAKWCNDNMYNLMQGDLPTLGFYWDLEVESVKRSDVWYDLKDVLGTQQSWYPSIKDKIGIYASYSYFNQYIPMDEMENYGVALWSAQYGYHENSLKEEYPNCNHVGWQYTDMDGYQDVSEWYGEDK